MSHGNTYDHLFESADEQIARSIHDEETNMFRELTLSENADARGIDHDACCGWTGKDSNGWDCTGIDVTVQTVYGRTKEIVSNFTRRNLDGAQYAQPRGSQYEGSDW